MRSRFLDWQGPIPFAHRGGAGDHPENTMAAFRAAVAMGYRHLETDVHLTRDGAVVAFHDSVLERVTDRRGRIEEVTTADLAEADAGYWFSRDGGGTFPHRGTGVRVPLLTELLEEWPQAFLNIDTKSDAVVEPLATLLSRMDVLDRVCVGSFSDDRLRRFRALAGDGVCTSMGPRAITRARLSSLTGRIPRQGALCIQLPVRQSGIPMVEPLMIRAAHRSGLAVHVWTIDDGAEMERLLDLGVDGIMTDTLDTLRGILRRRGAWHEDGAAP
ncbi:MAG: glycerophosphodiester phosphodiesterase [Chloroflexi bacterium]|nr:MAG: glycerophosphodiester phosphodiesterase [Chloroflexota bacterium]